jgi:hypothetical protein
MDIVRLAKSRCKTHLRASAPRLYGLASAGWRRLRYTKFARYHWTISLYGGADLTRLVPLDGAAEPILSRENVSDVDAEFVADPFLVRDADMWCLFFEVANRRRGKGEIGLATSVDLRRWDYQGIVISERHHLSYPYVFSHGGRWYMTPETGEAGVVLLYEADRFPYEWAVRTELLKRHSPLDPSPFHFSERWWMFIETSGSERCDELSLYHSDELLGCWTEHPRSPVIRQDPSRARPAGRVIVGNGRPIRFAQDCSGEYGAAVSAFEVIDLSATSYSERPLGIVLAPGAGGAYRNGMHHIDAAKVGAQWLACVDGR